MLRAMNAYNMYFEPEDQHIFQKEAPNLMKSMWQANLLVTKSSDISSFNYALLPVSFETPPQDMCTTPVLSSRSSDEISEGTSSTSLSIVGPAGDESPCVLETLNTQSTSLISEITTSILPRLCICTLVHFDFVVQEPSTLLFF
ncbi:unnamed protein product [Trichobilharzia regenti]|nr:unnamed protein product [Trichobilharzia regenti]